MSDVFGVVENRAEPSFAPRLDTDFDPSRGAGVFEGAGRQSLAAIWSGARATAGLAAAGILELAGAKELQESVFERVVDPAIRRRQLIDEDAQMYGMASNIMSSIGTLVGENYFAPAIEGATRTGQELQEGKDLGTAAKLGATEAAVTGLTVALPFTLPAKGAWRYAKKVGYGLLSSLGVGEAGRQAEIAALEAGGYTAEAEQIKAGANKQRAIEAVMGLFFGSAAAGWARYAEGRAPRTADVDAAMTATARAADDATNPAPEVDPGTAALHTERLQTARAQAEAGQPVQVADDTPLPPAARETYDSNRQAAAQALRETTDDVEGLDLKEMDAPPRAEVETPPELTAEAMRQRLSAPEAQVKADQEMLNLFRAGQAAEEGAATLETVLPLARQLDELGITFTDPTTGNQVTATTLFQRQAALMAALPDAEQMLSNVTACVIGALNG